MSRIAGIGSFENPTSSSTILEAMLSALKTGSSSQIQSGSSNGVKLGWTGLRHPGLAKSERAIIVLDGSIDNRRDWPKAASDAQLFHDLFLRHGFEGAIQQLNGSFAMALYDLHDRVLWLARDRFGLKPVYYVQIPGAFGFASQPRALWNIPGVGRTPNRKFVALFAASHYRTFDNDREKSPYAQISQLPAAHFLRVTSEGLVQKCYWSLEDLPDFAEREPTLAAQYRDLLIDSVSLRLGSVERPAFTLSGGMDSSSVLASAVHLTGSKQHAFSTVYQDQTYDESNEIRSMLDATVEQWHPIRIGTPDVFGLIRQMIAAHDEPVATATWLSHFLLCRQAAEQGFNALFGGLGGDELNAGEYEYFFFFLRTWFLPEIANASIRKSRDGSSIMIIRFSERAKP